MARFFEVVLNQNCTDASYTQHACGTQMSDKLFMEFESSLFPNKPSWHRLILELVHVRIGYFQEFRKPWIPDFSFLSFGSCEVCRCIPTPGLLRLIKQLVVLQLVLGMTLNCIRQSYSCCDHYVSGSCLKILVMRFADVQYLRLWVCIACLRRSINVRLLFVYDNS